MLTYEPGERGEWLAATNAGRLVVVRMGAARSTIGSIWTSLVADDGVQGVLDELTSGGLFQTPPFAVLTWDGSDSDGPVAVRAIVRGDITLRLTTMSGQVEVSGRGISTWIEQSFISVSAFDVECGQPGTAAATTAATAAATTVAAATAAETTVAAAAETTVAAAAETTVAAAITATVAARTEASTSLPIAFGAVWTRRLSSSMDAKSVAGERQTVVPEQTIAEQTITEQTIAEVTSRGRDDDPGEAMSGYDHLFGATMMRGVEQAAMRAPDSDEETETETETETEKDINTDSGDHDGFTVMSGDIKKLRASRERPPRTDAAPAPVMSSLYLLLPNGVHEPLGQPVLVGRLPSVSKISGGQVPKLVSLGSGDQDLSRNHAQFTVEGDTVVVTDLHSRNGTMIVLPGKAPQKLRQGEPTAIIVGTVVDFGGGITITVCDD